MDEVLAGQQSFRNPGVVRVLYMLGFIENYGSSLSRIINAYDKSISKAEFLDMDHCFIVILPNLNPIDADGLGFEPQNEPQNELQKNDLLERIVRLIKDNPKITRKEISIKLGKSVSTIFRIWKDNPYIKFVGSSKNGHWEIIDKKEN